MKEKAIIFVVGLLLGAIISTGAIYAYTVANKDNNTNDRTQMFGENRPSMRDGQNDQNGGTPPELPNGDNSQNNDNTNHRRNDKRW